MLRRYVDVAGGVKDLFFNLPKKRLDNGETMPYLLFINLTPRCRRPAGRRTR